MDTIKGHLREAGGIGRQPIVLELIPEESVEPTDDKEQMSKPLCGPLLKVTLQAGGNCFFRAANSHFCSGKSNGGVGWDDRRAVLWGSALAPQVVSKPVKVIWRKSKCTLC